MPTMTREQKYDREQIERIWREVTGADENTELAATVREWAPY